MKKIGKQVLLLCKKFIKHFVVVLVFQTVKRVGVKSVHRGCHRLHAFMYKSNYRRSKAKLTYSKSKQSCIMRVDKSTPFLKLQIKIKSSQHYNDSMKGKYEWRKK